MSNEQPTTPAVLTAARALMDSLMRESAALRERADAVWDSDPDEADALDRQEVSLRLEAALLERDIAQAEARISALGQCERIGEAWTPTTGLPSSPSWPVSPPPPLPPTSRQP
jgi:hypothetical protein